jgi:ATP-binding cassette subfamily B (MDR/TAP) protein 1
VVQAFGQEKTEVKNYDKFLDRAKAAGIKSHFFVAFAIGFTIFGMLGYYAYAFYVGSILVLDQVENTTSHEAYSGGDIIACFFGIVFGLFSISMATPNIKAVVEGQLAGKLAYDIINRAPKINNNDEKAKKLTNLSGRIEFKNVDFSYPTRQD